jgi:zinc transport system substrate-binding protein
MKHQNFLKILFFFIFALSVNLCAQEKVLVSVAPYVHLVERIGGEDIGVELLVPQGASPHTYEPTPKQIQAISKAKVWFCLGEPIEDKVRPALLNLDKNLVICDLHTGLDLIYEEHGHNCCHHHNDYDPHLWMSPKLMMKQVITIAKCLQNVFPDLKDTIEKNSQDSLKDLQTLDSDITKLFEGKKERVVLVAHPAYGYFCRDYGIKQISIEMEGKDPTAKELTALINEAKKLNIKKIFVQNQYSHKGAELIAKEIGAKIVVLNPYSDNYIPMMERIAYEFANAQEDASHE